VNDELRQFCHALQQMFKRRLNVSAVFAGLPEAVSEVVNHKTLTFLRRAKRAGAASRYPPSDTAILLTNIAQNYSTNYRKNTQYCLIRIAALL